MLPSHTGHELRSFALVKQVSADTTLQREQETLAVRQQALQQATTALQHRLAAFNTRHAHEPLDLYAAHPARS